MRLIVAAACVIVSAFCWPIAYRSHSTFALVALSLSVILGVVYVVRRAMR